MIIIKNVIETIQQFNDERSINTKSLNTIPPEKNYTKISRELTVLSITGCDKCSAAAYQTYCFCIAQHPDSIITPTKVAAKINAAAKRNGGKTVSEQTIRKHFAQLEKVGLVEREYWRDKDGKFLGGTWAFFSSPIDGKKTPPGDIEKNSSENKGIESEKMDETAVKKTPAAYNKVRVVSRHKTKSNSNTKSVAERTPPLERPKYAPALLDAITAETQNEAMIGRDLIDRSLKNFGPEYTLELIRYAKEKNPQNPGAVMNEPSRIYYASITARLKSKKLIISPQEKAKKQREEEKALIAEKHKTSEISSNYVESVYNFIDNSTLEEKIEIATKLSKNSNFSKILRPVFGGKATDDFVNNLLKKPRFAYAISEMIGIK